MNLNILLKTGTLLLFAGALNGQINIETAVVGDAGNAADSTGYGAVGYEYHIGKYEVTNTQYVAFLNAAAKSDPHGLYSSEMGSGTRGGITRSGSDGSYSYAVKAGYENKPVNYVSFWDAARFANWLSTGDTENGVYNLGGVTNPANNTVTRNASAFAAGGVAIASEDEWYKAAYYDPTLNGGAGAYWLYPTMSNSTPSHQLLDPDPGNNANYYNTISVTSPDHFTDVGSFENSGSYYGTFDQGGNVWEFNDTIVSSSDRGLRGGGVYSISSFGYGLLQSSYRNYTAPESESSFFGFRISSTTRIPEPSTYALIFGGLALAGAIWYRRRKA